MIFVLRTGKNPFMKIRNHLKYNLFMVIMGIHTPHTDPQRKETEHERKS